MSLIQTFPNGGGESSQVTVFPTASAAELGSIYQYIGPSTLEYENGCFYKCIYDETTSSYAWEPIQTQSDSTYETDPIDFDDF